MKILLQCLLVILLSAVSLTVVNNAEAAHGGQEPSEKKLFTKHFQASLFDITEHASYSIEVLLDDKEYKIGKDVIGIVVHGSHDEDVIGAKLTISLKDLKTGKEVAVKPMVTDKHSGLYIVSGVDLEKNGRWELSITVKKDSVEDGVKFILPDALKDRPAKGRYSP